jgi:FkbM family methyltransferase
VVYWQDRGMARVSSVSRAVLRCSAMFVAAASVARTAYALTNLRREPPIAAEPLSEQPLITVIIPARNEEATIGHCLSGLRAQRHQALRIFVVDDDSSDDTAAIVEKHAAEDSRVRVLRSEGPPPAGWAGKVHAMHLGVGAADRIDDWPGRTDWLLFFDADTIARPDFVGRLLATAEEREADLVSAAGATDGTRACYWLLMPSVNILLWEYARPDGRGKSVLAVGHCILLRRSAYDRVGGWARLADSRIDDVAMATLVRDSGGRTQMVDSKRELFTTGWDRFADGWRSMRKSWVGATNGDLRALALAGVSQLVYGLTPPSAVAAGLRRHETRLLLAGAVGWTAQAVAHARIAQRLGQPAASGVLAPFSWAAFGCNLGDAARSVASGNAFWRGRPVVTTPTQRSRTGLYCINRWEAEFLRKEVKLYIAHGIQLESGATVVDVGANIGIFSAYVHQLLGGAVSVFAFEPLPPIFAMLERNAREHFGGRVMALPYGLSSREDEVEFTYFPSGTLWSSSQRNRDNLKSERERIARSIARWAGQVGAGPVLRRVPKFIMRRIAKGSLWGLKKMETYRVRVRPLSAVIDELSIEVIDLLKIDVEGVETDVLSGIDERHWPMIRQAVVEVEGWEKNHPLIRQLFESKGFRVHAEQDSIQKAGDIGIIYTICAPAGQVDHMATEGTLKNMPSNNHPHQDVLTDIYAR